MPFPDSVLVMGVSGSGKTTVGERLAARLRLPFVDADGLHPQANVDKMAAGIPLTDDDRWPWLDAVGEIMAREATVMACSALRAVYRDRLRAAAPGLAVVSLDGSRELLSARLGARRGHFMPLTLLDSQLATLERPDGEPRVVVVDIALPPDELVALAADRLEQLT